MRFGKLGIVLVVVIALVGVYYFAPNLLSGVASDEVRISPRYVNMPVYTPDDLAVQAWVDGTEVDANSFTLKVGSTHSITIRATLPTGAIYGERTMMMVMPSESGNYDLVIDARIGTMELVAT